MPEPIAEPPAVAPRPVSGASWGAVAPLGADTALGLAARMGAYCWAEQQVFALLGGWTTEIPEPDAKLMVAEHADHAAWRARQWYDLLPTAPPGPDALVAGPSAVAEALARVAEVVEGTAEPEGSPTAGSVARVAVAYRVVLPRLGAALRAHLDWTSAVAEPEVGRVLRLCLDDVVADWVAGERMLQALADGPLGTGPAYSAATWLEEQIAAAGGLLGPGSTGARPVGGAT